MENDLDKTLLLALSKSVFYICITVTFCFLFSTCTVNPEVIIQCEISCQETGSKMKSCTARECECESNNGLTLGTQPWVLP